MATGFVNQLLNQLGTGDEIKDWQHASRTFVDGLYRLSPINPRINPKDPSEIGMLAKTVTLPKFSVQTKTYNAYNRKNIAQERIIYDPISLTFHDDSSNIVRDFWQGYYQFYYRDWEQSAELFKQESKYTKRPSQNWGLSPQSGPGAIPYINSIRIYSLHQKSFSSYILMNPTITSFAHGQHSAGDYDPLEHTMQIEYEALHYESGPVSSGRVQGFAHVHYDKTASPLSSLGGGTTSLLGPGGAVEGAGDVLTNLGNGNFAAAALGAFRTSGNFKKTNILRGQNPQSSIFVPTMSSIQSGLSKAIKSVPGLVGATKPRPPTNNMN